MLGDMPQTEHVTVTQAAKILGVSRWTVTRALKDDRHPLNGHKLGANTVGWLLLRADVEAYRDSRDAERGEAAS